LVFRSPSMAQHAVTLLNNTEWLSGGCDGTLQVCACVWDGVTDLRTRASGPGLDALKPGQTL
jgi:hypothetical protein